MVFDSFLAIILAYDNFTTLIGTVALDRFPYESSWSVSIFPLELWRRWETFPTLCEIKRRQIRTAIGNSFMKLISWVFIVSTRHTEKKNFNSAWKFCSLMRYLSGPGDDIRNVHLDKTKIINVISLWPHISSVSSVKSEIDC